MMPLRNLPELADAVQRNCDISDARHAGDYGMCTFLLKMREFYRWEQELPLTRALPRAELGDWLSAREAQWRALEAEPFRGLPLEAGEADPMAAEAANRELLPRGAVYSAGYGRFGKPVFFLGALARVEEREGLRVIVSSCEYARELAAPPAMLQGRTIYVRQESVRRYLWEKIEEWQWRKAGNRMARALAGYDFVADPEGALARMAGNEIESMILHEIGEARAGELLGPAWEDMLASPQSAGAEAEARAVRDLLADCLVTLPALIARENRPALHFHFATFDAPRRELFPEALEAYEAFAAGGSLRRLARVAAEGAERWLAEARARL
ncbi:MAG: Sfum_1244 family protein [Burkholderiales bacterium]